MFQKMLQRNVAWAYHVSLRNSATALTRCIGASLAYELRIASRSGRACNGDEQLARTPTINMRHDTWYRRSCARANTCSVQWKANQSRHRLLLFYILADLSFAGLTYDRFSRAFRITRCIVSLAQLSSTWREKVVRYGRKLILTRGNDRSTCRFAARHAILAQPKTEMWSSPWKSRSCWWTKQFTRFAPGVSPFHFPWYRHLPDAPSVSWSLEQTSSPSSCCFSPAGASYSKWHVWFIYDETLTLKFVTSFDEDDLTF